MWELLRTIAWIACVIYSTIPAFWLLIHPRADYWRSRRGITLQNSSSHLDRHVGRRRRCSAPWRDVVSIKIPGPGFPPSALFLPDSSLYKLSHHQLHTGAARRPARNLTRTPTAAPRHHGHPRPCAPSRLSRASLRNARLERRHGLAVCWALDCFRNPYRSADDRWKTEN